MSKLNQSVQGFWIPTVEYVATDHKNFQIYYLTDSVISYILGLKKSAQSGLTAGRNPLTTGS